jgi:hypothetical protein
VVVVVTVDIGIERAGVDDQRDEPTSARMISSIRSEMSLRPLRPEAAAPRRRRLPAPRCCSSAVRVTSAIVLPRRCASCRSLASSSSESLTVVRRMYASIPPTDQMCRCRIGRSGGGVPLLAAFIRTAGRSVQASFHGDALPAERVGSGISSRLVRRRSTARNAALVTAGFDPTRGLIFVAAGGRKAPAVFVIAYKRSRRRSAVT